MAERDEHGRLKKGQVLNPGGRPKIPENIKEACRAHSEEAIETLADIMADPEANPNARIKACEILLNRAWGTPTQSVEISGAEGGPIKTTLVEVAFVPPK